ncbi:MAG: hypothetical protein N2D54_06430 [Chloroflexota bacterium]
MTNVTRLENPNQLTSNLYKHLWDAELFPPNEDYHAVLKYVNQTGRQELRMLSKAVGRMDWWRGIWSARIPNPYLTTTQLIGWGQALTKYLIAPVSLPEREKNKVASLGALANFIVNLYDFMADQHRNQEIKISHEMLAKSMDPNPRELGDTPPISSILKLINTLSKFYFQGLLELPYANQNCKVNKIIQRAVVKMYKAENSTIQWDDKEQLPPSNHAIVVKDAYPFMIMGLAAWLAVPKIDPNIFSRHLRWLYKVGIFYGWVDDAVDLEKDRLIGHPNLFSSDEKLALFNKQAQTELSKKITTQGQDIRNEWMLQTSLELPLIQHIFTASLATWFSELQ